MFINDITNEYLNNLLALNIREDELYEFKKEAVKNNVPVIHDDVQRLIEILIKSNNIKRILEVGTAVGFSSCVFSTAMGKQGKVVTLERMEEVYEKAKNNIAKFGLQDNIFPKLCDASEYLKEEKDLYDMIFLDGNKGHYIHMLDDCIRILKPGGLLICDNVLFRGMVDKSSPLIRRKITIVKRLRKFLIAISENEHLQTSILPIGDGLSISVKTEE